MVARRPGISGGRTGLPGEHGFRFFPGFYLNLGDTMRRIPTADGTVYDRLVRGSTYRMSFADRPDLTVPLSLPPEGVTPETFVESLTAALVGAYKLPPHEALYCASKLFVYVTSCDERRLGQWDWDPGEWSNRPESVTAIPNLFLAGDWVRTHINVTTMDGANQGGRQAANGVLDAARSNDGRATLWPLYEPPEYRPHKLIDRARYQQGLPNMFDPDQAAPPRR